MSFGPSQVTGDMDFGPFDFVPEAAQANGAAALCLHGLTGTPFEVRPVAEALVERGIRARSIWMAGHNGTVDDLAATPREAWVSRARDALAALRAEHDRVFLVGMSMGGVVSLRLAQTEAVDGLVVIAAPIQFSFPIPQLLPLIRLFRKSRPKVGSGIEDPVARENYPRFPAMPFACVHELIRLQREVVPRLAEIRQPILVAHGLRDKTANPKDAERIHAGVSTPEADKALLLLERSGHIAPVDYDGPALCRAAADFLGPR